MRLSSKIKWKLVILSHVQLLYCKIVQHLNHPKFTCNKRMQEKPVTQRKMKRRLKAIPRERYGTNIWASNIKSSATTLQSIHQYLGFKVAQTMLEPNPLVTRFNQSISKSHLYHPSPLFSLWNQSSKSNEDQDCLSICMWDMSVNLDLLCLWLFGGGGGGGL